LSRRTFLGGSLAAAAWGQQAETSAFDPSLLDDWVTPSELFFVREHFPQPQVSEHGWKLTVSGAAAGPFEISYDELLQQPRKTLPATLECAENPVGGGLVSHAEWVGVGLGILLARAQPRAEARFVRLAGADGFSRTIPNEKARHGDTLLAHMMNGERLPEKHGFPSRAIIPGWYGMDSVKWLNRIELLAGIGGGLADDYQRTVRSLLAPRQTGPVTAMNVKAIFSRPVDGAVLVGRKFMVRGAAWAGENRVKSVEVSADGGTSWVPARLGSEPLPYAWVHWAFDWKIEAPGPQELMVRASDDAGRTQPAERPRDRVDNYEQNGYQTVRVMAT
jgi:DMSO/TMAO reductase YedYZ molybdopterin-dependent catalytic subunit